SLNRPFLLTVTVNRAAVEAIATTRPGNGTRAGVGPPTRSRTPAIVPVATWPLQPASTRNAASCKDTMGMTHFAPCWTRRWLIGGLGGTPMALVAAASIRRPRAAALRQGVEAESGLPGRLAGGEGAAHDKSMASVSSWAISASSVGGIGPWPRTAAFCLA